MKAYTINQYSKNERLTCVERPEPALKANEVLVQIHSAGVNQLDAKIKSGEFKLLLPYKFPLILGHDLAGVVVKTGANIGRWKVGDEVFARPADHHIGTFAEYIAVDEKDLAPKPNNISMDEAASLPLVALTVWQALVDKAKLKKGQKIFIQAGSRGVGTIAIQLPKHLGATVATTTSAANSDMVKQLGADVIIDYKKEDFGEVLEDYDVVLNSQDSETLLKSLEVLKPEGQLISVSGPPDVAFAKEAGLPWFMKAVMYFLSAKVKRRAKQLNVGYSFLFMQANGKQLEEIGLLVEKGIIKPQLDRVFPFEQTNKAIDYVASGRAKGKVVIKVK